MKYLERLQKDKPRIQNSLEVLLEMYKTQPVGSGYIDIIINPSFIEELIHEITSIGIAINGVTWWCHCSEENKKRLHCPHGLGGPTSVYYDGWFSEMGIDYECFDITQETYDQLEYGHATSEEIKLLNKSALDYIADFNKSALFVECFFPAIWLHTPKGWKRAKYLV